MVNGRRQQQAVAGKQPLAVVASAVAQSVLGCGFKHRPGASFPTGGETPPQPAGADACATFGKFIGPAWPRFFARTFVLLIGHDVQR